MKPLSIDQIRNLLPDVEELQPLGDGLLGVSHPDESRRWAGSGELGTLGERLVEIEEFRSTIPAVLDRVRAHLSQLYEAVGEALRALASDDVEGALHGLLRAGEIEREAGRIAEADAFIASALRLATRLRDGKAALPALMEGARTARALGRWESAESRYRQAAALAEDAGDRSTAASALIGAGNVAVDRGIWERAHRLYLEAEIHVRELPADAPQAWHIALNRSIVAREAGQLDEAEAHLARAEELVGETDDAAARTTLSNARGQLLRIRGRAEEAELAFRRAFEAAAHPDARVTIAVNLADVLVSMGHTLEAGEIAREAEELALRARVAPRLPEVYTILGRVAAARGHADAFVFFERALDLIRERRLPEIERARALEAYGAYDRGRGEEESGRARLEEAARIYEELGCRTSLEEVRTLLTSEVNGDAPRRAPEDDTHDS